MALLDGAGLPPGDSGMGASTRRAAHADHGNVGWIAHTLSAGEGDQIPLTATIRLHYTVGPLEPQQQIVPDDYNIRTGVSLEGDSQLNDVGQDASGNTFVTIAIDVQKSAARRFGIIAVTQDGRLLESSPAMSTDFSTAGATVGIARFEFEVPLADVAHFRVGTRPVRTMEWKDVFLARESIFSKPAAGPASKPVETNACVARWPQGRMELVTVSAAASASQRWWRPNGLPLADLLDFEPSARVNSPEAWFRREFVIMHEVMAMSVKYAFARTGLYREFVSCRIESQQPVRREKRHHIWAASPSTAPGDLQDFYGFMTPPF